MLPASLRPKEVEDKIAKDVKRLSDVGEASYMIPLDPGGIIFSLEDSFTQHDEWPEKSDVIGRSPFLPYVIEGLPSPFGKGTFEGTMLRGFRGLLCANLARGVATSLWPSVGVKPNTWKSWGFGVLRDSRMFKARQKGPKHLALVIWTSVAQVMVKRRAGNQTGSLTFDH
jgi:hypothetical protein